LKKRRKVGQRKRVKGNAWGSLNRKEGNQIPVLVGHQDGQKKRGDNHWSEKKKKKMHVYWGVALVLKAGQ